MRCLNSAVSTVPLPSLSRARNARVTLLIFFAWMLYCSTASNLFDRFCKYAILLFISRPPKNHDPSNDTISHRFFIVGGVHLVAHHVTELRKLDLTRAIRVVLQGKSKMRFPLNAALSISCLFSLIHIHIYPSKGVFKFCV